MHQRGIQAAAKVFQAVECIDVSTFDGLDVVTLPWAQVRGAQLLVNVIDNFATRFPLTSGQDSRYWAALEVSIWGAIQGYSTCLKRQHVRMISGPMFYNCASDEFYSAITVRARNMTGGRTGGNPTVNGGSAAAIAANGFSIQCQVMLVAPDGIGEGF